MEANKMPSMKSSGDSENKKEVEKPIEVLATRAGFIQNRRIKAGDRFEVQKFSELGEWMKCIDSNMEKKRVQFFKDKKKAK